MNKPETLLTSLLHRYIIFIDTKKRGETIEEVFWEPRDPIVFVTRITGRHTLE
jgi:hypothetical protein